MLRIRYIDSGSWTCKASVIFMFVAMKSNNICFYMEVEILIILLWRSYSIFHHHEMWESEECIDEALTEPSPNSTLPRHSSQISGVSQAELTTLFPTYQKTFQLYYKMYQLGYSIYNDSRTNLVPVTISLKCAIRWSEGDFSYQLAGQLRTATQVLFSVPPPS